MRAVRYGELLSYNSGVDGELTSIPSTINAEFILIPRIQIPKCTDEVTIQPLMLSDEMASIMRDYLSGNLVSREPNGSDTKSRFVDDDEHVRINNDGFNRTQRSDNGGMEWSHMFALDYDVLVKFGEESRLRKGAELYVNLSIKVSEADLEAARSG
jgi:hypothetical protein